MKYTCEDLTWIAFNKLVFEEATKDRSIDEKIKFLAISSDNFEEFNRIRIAKLQNEHNIEKISELSSVIKSFIKEQEKVYDSLIPEFNRGVRPLVQLDNLNELDMIQSIVFNCEIRNVNEKPYMFNADSLYLMVENLVNRERHIVEIPSNIKRVHEIQSGLVLVEDMVKLYLKNKTKEQLNIHTFRITRDAVYNIDDCETLMTDLQTQIMNKNKRQVTRLEIENHMSVESIELLRNKFDVLPEQIYYFNVPLYLGFLMNIVNTNVDIDSKIYPEFDSSDIFNILDRKDMILEHPFESFENVYNFIKTCCRDKFVTHIYQTIYRVSKNSKIVDELINAANNGKEVTVYVEIGSPNDEERNINLVRKLQQTKCNVVYRYRGLTTHAKCFIAVRNKDGVEKRYSHISTGNYNEVTTKNFIDLSFFTNDKTICSDVSKIFNQMYYNTKYEFDKILVTQNNFRSTILNCIDNEISNANKGIVSNIKIKINALTDEVIINKLYDAADTGVKVDLIVRGSCKLNSELNENISKEVLVGDLLHHNRLYYFENGGDSKVFVGSVDLVPEKIDKRIDFIYPTSGECKEKVLDLIKRDFKIK